MIYLKLDFKEESIMIKSFRIFFHNWNHPIALQVKKDITIYRYMFLYSNTLYEIINTFYNILTIVKEDTTQNANHCCFIIDDEGKYDIFRYKNQYADRAFDVTGLRKKWIYWP